MCPAGRLLRPALHRVCWFWCLFFETCGAEQLSSVTLLDRNVVQRLFHSGPAHHRGVWGPSVISHDWPPCVEREVSLESRWFADRHLQNTIWCSQRKVAKAGHAVMLSPRKHTTIGIVAGLEGSAVQVSLQMIGFIWQRLFATFPGTHERPLCISE